MEDDRDIGHDVFSAVRGGRLEKVKKLISIYFGLSYSQDLTDGYDLICKAIKNNHSEVAKLLLTNGYKVNCKSNVHFDTPLHYAVTNGNIEIVEMLLDRGANIDAECRNGTTPLYPAVKWKKMEIVELLLNRGAKVNAKGKDGISYLHIAIDVGHVPIVEHLLRHGADVNSVCTYDDNEYCSPLYLAVINELETVVQLLLERGAKVDAQDQNGETILSFAVKRGHSLIIEHLLKYSPDVNNTSNRSAFHLAVHSYGKEYSKITDKLFQYGFPVNLDHGDNCKLHGAVEIGYLKIVEEELVKYGVSIDSKDKFGSTALHIACQWSKQKIFEILLKFGADVHFTDVEGNTALHIASQHIDPKIVEILLQSGAYINSKNKYGETALHIASECSTPETVKVLLKFGADIDSKDDCGNTALHIASGKFDREVVEALLKFGARIDIKNKYGRTALDIASGNCVLEIIEPLLKFGADIESKYGDGETMLHIASRGRNPKLVEVLLKFGADVDSKNKCGNTALHIIASRKDDLRIIKNRLKFGADIDCKDSGKFDREILEALFKFGASIDIKNKYGRTALNIAFDSKDTEIMEALLKFGADIESKNEHGETMLHIASTGGNPELVEVLLKFGADIHSKNKCGNTALHNASRNNYLWIIKPLLKFGADVNSINGDGRTAFHIACIQRSYYVAKVLLDHGSDITVISEKNYPGSLAEIFKRHAVKVKTANLYVRNEKLLSISSDGKLNKFRKECEREVASMKSEKVDNANISFYDILTKGISQLAIYAGNESIVQIFESDDYKIKFPIYATLLNSNFINGERRKQLLEQGRKMFYCFTNSLGIPYVCTEKIFHYLCNDDLKSIMDACKPISVSSLNTDNK